MAIPNKIPLPAPRQPGASTHFIVGDELIPHLHDGQSGALLKVRLTNYRSLPLSCICTIELAVDGTAIPSNDLVLILNGNGYPLPTLSERSDIVWFVLDPAYLFIPLLARLNPGSHEIFGALHFVSPSASGGRTVQVGSARVQVRISEPIQA